jgi:hypothetical protein
VGECGVVVDKGTRVQVVWCVEEGILGPGLSADWETQLFFYSRTREFKKEQR